MLKLGVNIDHVATLRQARYRDVNAAHFQMIEPSPLQAARAALSAGAHSITAHLREDQRHIQRHDVLELMKDLNSPLNLEMAVTDAMTEFALQLHPADVCLVPENRREVTTEGGLAVTARFTAIQQCCSVLAQGGIRVSLFIDPEPSQIRAAVDCGAPCIELHTGSYANALSPGERKKELQKLVEASALAHSQGLQVNAGHGLNYDNLAAFLSVPHLDTLNIGHAIVSRAIFSGMENAVQDILAIMQATAS